MYTGAQKNNEKRNLEAIADGYKSKLSHKYWLPDALQKDAVQNSWDARINKKTGEGWEMQFKLIEINKTDFLIIQDKGTTGLTGSLWGKEDKLDDILISQKESENLAHFVSSNYSAKGSESGGKRGRGKSLFLFGSKDLTFYFESLRESDGRRVAGSIFIGENKGANIELDSESPEEYLRGKLGKDIDFLKKSGTRIFIKKPKKELKEALKNGSLLQFIERTWWEIIKKKGVTIKINDGNDETIAKLPEWYNEEWLKSNDFEIKEYKNLSLNYKSFRIKRIKLIYDPSGGIPDGIKGLSIQRKGMKVESRKTRSLVEGEEGIEKIYGWIEMDNKLEDAMYDLEDVEHLSFNWVSNPASKLLRQIKTKVYDFAKSIKLIESKLSKQRKIHRKIEEDVAKSINEFLNNKGFSAGSIGGITKSEFERSNTSPLRVSLSNFDTGGGKRVDYGDVIKAEAVAINDLEVPITLLHRTWIADDNGEVIIMKENEHHLHSGIKQSNGWIELKIKKNDFPVGDYSFRSKIVVLEDTDLTIERYGKVEKGLEISRSSSFSVGKQPESKGFLSFSPIESDDYSRYVSSRPESDSLVIEYNTKHPYIEKLIPEDRSEGFRRFLLEVGITVAFNQVLLEDITRDKPKMFDGLDKNVNPAEVLPRIMKEVGKFMSTQ